MPKRHSPRKGSLQFWPRKRAKKAYARIRSWAKLDNVKLLGFAGYKAGMTHIMLRDTSTKLTKGETIKEAVTVIECPPLKVLGIRFYKNTDNGLEVINDLYSKNLDKELRRKIILPKKSKDVKEFDDLRLIVYTQPKLTDLSKKKPEIFEIAISGSKDEKLSFAKNLLDKEIKLSDVFKEGQFLDVHAVTKGKGFRGTVKRYGVTIRQHKSEKTKRGVGTLGAWTPKRVSWTVGQPGKMGFHLRTEYSKWNIKIGNKPEEINPKGGFINYGLIKNDYLLLKGSVPGSRKRLIIMTESIRKKKELQPELTYISLESKQ